MKNMGKSKDLVVWCRSREKVEEQRPVKSMEKKFSPTAASKQKPKQDRRLIRKEAKGSQCAGNRGGDIATSNAE